MRLGLFGGSFDPVHLGHLLMAEAAREQLALDELWFIPAAQSPHKQHGPRASGKQRVEMLRLAVAGHPAYRVCEIEVNRQAPSYTVDTLAEIHEERPDDALFLLLGGDAAVDFPSWREPDRILTLATLAVFRRPEWPEPDLAALVNLHPSQARPPQLITAPPIGIRSTDIRERLRAGKSIRWRVPRAVEEFLKQPHLYG